MPVILNPCLSNFQIRTGDIAAGERQTDCGRIVSFNY